MTKAGYINCGLTLALVAYLVTALVYTNTAAKADTQNSLQINIIDSISRGFVTAAAIDQELGDLSQTISTIPRSEINTYDIEQRIMSMDKIENANCVFLNNGALRIDVTPLQPVARVFDTKGGNYYINRSGKRMESSHLYRIDVPVIVGNFNPNRDPSICFPLLDYLAEQPNLSVLVSAIEIKNNRDIILIPSIKGHVVNIGDTRDIENKFDRLMTFYHKVMPVKGWEYYDTISVKWRSQVVAHRRYTREARPEMLVEEHDDIDDVETMSAPQNLPPIVRGRETPSGADTKAKDNDKKDADKKDNAEKKTDEKKADDKKASANTKTDDVKANKAADKKSSTNTKTDNKKAEPNSDTKTEKKTNTKTDKKADVKNEKKTKKQA